MKAHICKSCKIQYTPEKFAQPRCRNCIILKEREKRKKYKPLKVNINLKQKKINKLVRERDKGKPCISCGEFKPLFAGHYISVGRRKALRYDLRNIHGQCFECNNFKSGKPKQYRLNLIERFGIEFVESLEREANVLR
jgi:hypothetical protein